MLLVAIGRNTWKQIPAAQRQLFPAIPWLDRDRFSKDWALVAASIMSSKTDEDE
jgi:hypothetical protein